MKCQAGVRRSACPRCGERTRGARGPGCPASLLLGSDLLRWEQQRAAPGPGPVPGRLPLGLVHWEAVAGDRDGRRGGLLLPSFWARGIGPRLGPPAAAAAEQASGPGV